MAVDALTVCGLRFAVRSTVCSLGTDPIIVPSPRTALGLCRYASRLWPWKWSDGVRDAEVQCVYIASDSTVLDQWYAALEVLRTALSGAYGGDTPRPRNERNAYRHDITDNHSRAVSII